MKRTASAVWQGSLKAGKGALTAPGGALKNTEYSFGSRFESGAGTNPEELIGAAHASCFSMALAHMLAEAGTPATKISTVAHVTVKDLSISKIKLETKGVVHMALLFGSTWVVNSIVFFAILVMILFSNLFVSAFKPKKLWPFYALLSAALLVNAFVPLNVFLSLAPTQRIIASCAVVFVPIFFAGVIFATSRVIRRSTNRAASRPVTRYLNSGDTSISAAAFLIALYSCS